MKQKEFEWLKNWLTEVIIDFRSELNINKIFNDANEKYPPPIDKLSFATTLHCHKHHTNFEDKCPECEKDPKPDEELRCPDCGTATMGIGGEGAHYQCILCKKKWDFDWENLIVLNPQPNIRPTVPGMKERKEEPKPGQYEGTVCAKCHQRDCKCPERCPKCHNWGKYCKCEKDPKPDLKRNLTGPLPWGNYRVWSKEKLEGETKMVVLDGAIFPKNHQGHKVDLTVQHSPKSTCYAIGTEVYCQDCKTAFSISSQFLEKIVEPPK